MIGPRGSRRKRGKLTGDGHMGLNLDGTIVLHHLVAERCELGPAAGQAPMLRLDDWRLKKPVKRVH